jgi:periplasmic divalent cation tolerance protein
MEEASDQVLIVFVTAGTQVEAEKISEAVVRCRAAACATMLPIARSFYWWEGKLVNEEESVILFKTTAARFKHLEKVVRETHTYTVPEIIAIPVREGWPQYLEWVRKETSRCGE